MAEDAAFALYSCIKRHVHAHVLWSVHGPTRSQPARHAGRAARRRQRGARRPAPAAEPVGDEPGAGAAARDDRRSAAGAGRARPRADAARARTARAGRPAGAGRRGGPAPRRKARPRQARRAPSRCAPARASSRTSARRSSPASAARRPACGCASCRSPTRTARRCATAASIWRPASSGRTTGPEVRTQALFRDRFVGVVRTGAPAEPRRESRRRAMRPAGTSPSRAAAATPGRSTTPCRRSGWSARSSPSSAASPTALALARASDLIATVPERHTGSLRAGMHSFALPVATPEITVSLLWHPRLDADPAHRWLRGCVREACAG